MNNAYDDSCFHIVLPVPFLSPVDAPPLPPVQEHLCLVSPSLRALAAP